MFPWKVTNSFIHLKYVPMVTFFQNDILLILHFMNI